MSDKKSGYYLRDFRLPHRKDLHSARQRFQGYVRFIINRSVASTFAKDLNVGSNPSTLVRTASLPEIKYKTEVKNQYNRKKIVTTGLDYTPVTIKVIDTAYNQWLDIIMRYYAYNFMNGRNLSEGGRDMKYILAYEIENINSAFKTDSFKSNRAGYALNASPYFFERIDFILYAGQKGVQYSIFNPVLTGFTTGEIDYSSSELLDFELSFEYENFTVYNSVNFRLDNVDLSNFEAVRDYGSTIGWADPWLLEREIPALGMSPQSYQNKIVNYDLGLPSQVLPPNTPGIKADPSSLGPPEGGLYA